LSNLGAISYGGHPVHVWTDKIEPSAGLQLANMSRLPFLHPHGLAVMPDVHAGIGSTVGTVIATHKAIIPAAVGVDIGCGMNAVRLSLRAEDLPDSLAPLRYDIEERVPLGPGGAHAESPLRNSAYFAVSGHIHDKWCDLHPSTREMLGEGVVKKIIGQLGTLGSGNHFIEVCLDENNDVWVVLHSGSRGIGNKIGTHFISKAKQRMQEYFIHLPDEDLAYLPESTDDFKNYRDAVEWAQDYALENRKLMMQAVLKSLAKYVSPFTVTHEAINCHHNYVELESHFGRNVYVTRKGAIRARLGDLGVIPGSMGARSYIVRGKGNPDSYCSCSHGAGRSMSRGQARKQFTVADLEAQTAGVECNKTSAVLDEIPGAYKDIDAVMENQKDLVEIVHTLKQVLNVKGA
jgi:tRNA-splicing ligase RtcB (3'-phosphate/5'-hydroxy nucleic acid ligase)